MAPAYFLVFFLLSHLLLPLSAQEKQESYNPTNCLPYYCGDPKENEDSEFESFTVDNCVEPVQYIQLEMGEQWYDVVSLSLADTISLDEYSDFCKCESPENFNSSTSPYFTFRNTSKLNFNHLTPPLKCFIFSIISFECEGHHETPSSQCLKSHPPINIIDMDNGLFSLSTADIFFQVLVSDSCRKCYFKGDDYRGGMCYQDNNGTMHCNNVKGNTKTGLKLALGLGIGIPAVLIICFLILFFGQRHYKQKHASSDFLMRNISADPASKSELDRGGVYFGVPIFSYSELEEATNNFDPIKELGDGGFGTVYHGKLQDGREVAVKRLYENSYKRVEQFMNEVEILTRLRHKNLVSLYGCTSRHSKELLLVYEFIPNGTC